MKTKEILELMAKLFADLKMHPLFLKEIRQLLSKELRGKESNFFKILSTQLHNIEVFGTMIHTVDSNEKLKNWDKTFYSIHLQQQQFNIRLLIYITDDHMPLFLCAFYERSGKKKTDYTTYKSVLESRLNQMIGDDMCEQ